MATSPWIPFPQKNTETGVYWPYEGQPVFVRMRGWTRRPFQAIWYKSSEGWAVYGVYTTDQDGLQTNYFVPWWALDAWYPV